MFYRTQIKSVTSAGVVDKDGKTLTFMGYLPVKAGDWVFTDGTYIFGNVPPKGSPAPLGDEPGGIPILADTSYISEEDEALRGYFDKSGKFKKYAVAWDDWITNSEKNFAHGVKVFEDDIVIDADILDDGTQLIVTGGYSCTNTVLDTASVAFVPDDRLFSGRYLWILTPTVFQQKLGLEIFPDVNTPTRVYEIRSSGTGLKEINLDAYADDVEEHALEAAERIMAQSHVKSLNTRYMTMDDMMKVYYRSRNDPARLAKPPPAAPVITQTTVQILSCYHDEENDNGVGGYIFAATYGYCFPHIQPRFAKTWGSGYYSDLRAEGFEWAAYLIDEWKSVPFGFSALYKITDDEPEPISSRYYGGVKYEDVVTDTSKIFVVDSGGGSSVSDAYKVLQRRYMELLPNLEGTNEDADITIPVGDGFCQMDKFGRLSFYNSDEELVAEDIPVHENFLHVEIEHGEYDAHFPICFFNNKPHINCKLYTPDGVEERVLYLDDITWILYHNDFEASTRTIMDECNEQAEKNIPPLDGYYIQNDDDSLEPLQFTPLFHQFKDGSYLYGVRGGELRFKDKDGKETLIGDGIRNFHLKELKKISKAKR